MSYKSIFLNFIICFSVIIYILPAQNIKSIHQLEWEKHKMTNTHPSLIGDQNKTIIPLQTGKTSLTTTVFGYLPYWCSSEYLQYSLLSHIAVFAVNINSNGSIGNTHGWPWTNLINTAHSNGVKIVLTATLFSGNSIHTLITNQTYTNNFFVNIKNKMLEGNADGLNIDFESLNNGDKGANIINFMTDLTNYLHSEIPGCEVSFAGPAVNWGGHWDLVGLANSCDYIFIMGYSFSGSWSSVSGPMAPLTGGSINITNTVNTQYGSVTQNSPDKLILGVPYYGYHWKTVSGQPRSDTLGTLGSTFYESYQAGATTYNYIWDDQSQSPWYRFNDGDDWHQVWCDNDSSLGLKYNLAQSENLKGVGMWALDYDGPRMELWHELYERFGSGPMPPPNTPEAFRLLRNNESSLSVRFSPSSFATHYFIYLSNDGINFEDSILTSSHNTFISGLETDSLYFVRARAANDSALSEPTEVLAAIPSDSIHTLLIVNGFDRRNGTNNPLNYIRQHAQSIKNKGWAFSSASNEAIINESLLLENYDIVDWILGDESTVDETCNFREQTLIADFLDNGGCLFISGSEIGWDLSWKGYTADKQFYANYLKSQYLADAPLGQASTYYSVEQISGEIFDGITSFNFDNGTHGTFNVDWPDAINAINGGTNCLLYSGVPATNGVAGIYYNGLFPGGSSPGKLVYFSFPFETVYPESARDTLFSRIIDFFKSPPLNMRNEKPQGPQDFLLYQNYPNPFNSQTTISFILSKPGEVNIKIFDVLGSEVFSWSKENLGIGKHNRIWRAKSQNGFHVNSGTYFIKFGFADKNQVKFSKYIKIIYLK